MMYNIVFKKGDQVFFMQNNKINSGTVTSIAIHDTSMGVFAHYYLAEEVNENGKIIKQNIDKPFLENQLFASKELLRKSL